MSGGPGPDVSHPRAAAPHGPYCLAVGSPCALVRTYASGPTRALRRGRPALGSCAAAASDGRAACTPQQRWTTADWARLAGAQKGAAGPLSGGAVSFHLDRTHLEHAWRPSLS